MKPADERVRRDEILDYVTRFLQRAHGADERYTSRDGVNVARYALKLLGGNGKTTIEALRSSVRHVLGEEALRHLE